MKKQLTKAISKKAVTFLLLAFVSIGSQSAYALPDRILNKGAEITYTGLIGSKLAFNVNYRNELSQPFQLVIRNDQDAVIYSKQFEAKPLNRTILFTEFTDNHKLTFSIITGRKEVAQTFEINAQVKTVEEFIVKAIEP